MNVVTVGIVFCVLVSGYFYRDIQTKNADRDERLALIEANYALSKQALDNQQEMLFKNFK